MQLYAARTEDRPDDVWIQSGAASAVNDFGAALPCPERQNGITVHFILLSNHTKSKKERLFRKIFRKSRSETPSISHLLRPKGPLSEGAGNAAGIDWGSYHAKPHTGGVTTQSPTWRNSAAGCAAATKRASGCGARRGAMHGWRCTGAPDTPCPGCASSGSGRRPPHT